MLATRASWIDELRMPFTFLLSFLPLKKAICLVTPLCSPKVEIIAKMLIKTNANEKMPYSVCVVYLTMMTLPMKARSMPIIVPVKMMPVPFAIFWRLWLTSSDMVSLFIHREMGKGQMAKGKRVSTVPILILNLRAYVIFLL